MKMHLLLCEDEPKIAKFILQGLKEEGHDVEWHTHGASTLQQIANKQYDILILDLRLPDIDGLTVCREVRKIRPLQPVLMLTALDAIENRVAGLRAGADDYLPKPFAFDELIARLEALYRRSTQQGDTKMQAGHFTIDPYSHTCTYKNEVINLTPREFDLLHFFITHAGQNIPRETLYREVWQMPFEPNTNVVEVYIRYLRKALQTVGCTGAIVSVRGVGYRFNPD
ncbi:MAG: response regulator transcription factor [Bacteroidetes Order II. Incertae sedis bacterium]|nr:response regulator transcription factor [Bacteroidetes Order II. bacterium]